jgi:hypothetical protein
MVQRYDDSLEPDDRGRWVLFDSYERDRSTLLSQVTALRQSEQEKDKVIVQLQQRIVDMEVEARDIHNDRANHLRTIDSLRSQVACLSCKAADKAKEPRWLPGPACVALSEEAPAVKEPRERVLRVERRLAEDDKASSPLLFGQLRCAPSKGRADTDECDGRHEYPQSIREMEPILPAATKGVAHEQIQEVTP